MRMKTGSLLVVVGALTAGLGLASAAGAGDFGGGAAGGPVIVTSPVPAVPTVRRPIVDRIVPHGVYPNNITPGGIFALPEGERFGSGRPISNRHRRSTTSTFL